MVAARGLPVPEAELMSLVSDESSGRDDSAWFLAMLGFRRWICFLVEIKPDLVLLIQKWRTDRADCPFTAYLIWG